MHPPHDSFFAGLLLVLGGLVFFSVFPLAAKYPNLHYASDGPVATRLETVRAYARPWRAVPLAFNASVALTAVGIAFLSERLSDTPGYLAGAAAATLYGIAATLMIVMAANARCM